MALRIFKDDEGVEWQVWDTVPDASRRMVQTGYSEGWLTFQSDGQKRRLAPIPAGWVDAAEPALQQLRDRAVLVTRTALS
jgi:hypothetical protein